MESRLVFDTIPDQFDRYRSQYCPELFAALIADTGMGPGKSALELGPGTGQATQPILETGCDYHAIELGSHLCDKMRQKYGHYANFSIVNDDFITHSFGDARFDLIYSAATIQWIPQDIAFTKTFELLKPGGTLAMMLTRSDYRTPNEALYQQIQQVYQEHYKPDQPYQRGRFHYDQATRYGYESLEMREYPAQRQFTAEEYAGYCGTHCDHITIPEPHKSLFFDGIRQAVYNAGNKLVMLDTHVLYLAKKPL